MIGIDATKLKLIIPQYRTDQIIGIVSNTVSLSAPAALSQTTNTTPFPHSFGDSCYFQGIFTTDGGTTWNDFGAQTPNLAPPNPQFQTVDVLAKTDESNVTVYATNYYDTAHGSSSARTVSYKLYLLAKNTMAFPITPFPTNEKLLYSSDYNFQKVYLPGSTPFSVTSGNTASVVVPFPDDLGYIPTVRAFFSPSTAPTEIWSLTQFKAPPTSSPIIETRVQSSSVTFYSDQTGISGGTFSGTIEYRVYLDA